MPGLIVSVRFQRLDGIMTIHASRPCTSHSIRGVCGPAPRGLKFFLHRRRWVSVTCIALLLLAASCFIYVRRAGGIPAIRLLGHSSPSAFTQSSNPFWACMQQEVPPPDASFPVEDYIDTLCGGLFSRRATALGNPAFKSQWIRQLNWWHSGFSEFIIGRQPAYIRYGTDTVSTRPVTQWWSRLPQSGSLWWDCGLNPTIAIDRSRHVYAVCGIDRKGDKPVSFVRLYAVDAQGQLTVRQPIHELMWPGAEGIPYAEFFLFNGRLVWDLRQVKLTRHGVHQVDSSWYAFDRLNLIQLYRFVAFKRLSGDSACDTDTPEDCIEEARMFGAPWQYHAGSTVPLIGRRQQFNPRHGVHQVDISAQLDWDDSRWRFTERPQSHRTSGIPW